jgi:ribose-phosphate pyrophosphokinase
MFKLFSGSAHQTLSQSVSNLVKLPLSQAEIVRFGNSEVKVTIQEDVRDADCIIIQPTTNPTDENLMELLLFCDALKRSEARNITAIMPYFGYAKQNMQHRTGECVSVNVVIRMLESVGFDKIITCDIHDEATGGVFMIPYKNVTLFPFLAEKTLEVLTKQKIKKENIALLSPDQGAVEKVRIFGKSFFGTDDFKEVVIEKRRDQNVAHKAEPIDIYGDVKNKTVIIVDDMVVSGSTLLPAIDLCLSRGATEVYAAIVHNDFTASAPERLESSKLKKIITTNTIPLRKETMFSKLEQVDISSVLAKEIVLFIN